VGPNSQVRASVASIRVITCTVTSLEGTRRVASAIASLARVGDVIVLAGDMGAGKTAFAQAFGSALGVT